MAKLFKIISISIINKKALLFMLFFIHISVFGQQPNTYFNPYYTEKTKNTPDLLKVVVNDNFIILYFSFKTYQNICINDNFYLRDVASRTVFYFVKAEKISNCKEKQHTPAKDFIFYFDRTGKNTTEFDFVDPKIIGKPWLEWGINEINLLKKNKNIIQENNANTENDSNKKTEKNHSVLIELNDKMINFLSNDTLQSVKTQYELIDSTQKLLKSLGYDKNPNYNYQLISEKKNEIKKFIDKKDKTINDSSELYLNMIIIKQESFKGLKSALYELKKLPQNQENITKIGAVQNIIIMITRELNQMKNELLRLNNTIQKQNFTIKQQNTLLLALAVVFLFVVAIAFVLFRRNAEKRKTNKLLTEKNLLINNQKEEISEQYKLIVEKNAELEKKNRNITDSIMVAKRIQDALLPSEVEMKRIFPDSFIFYKPKNIVSGDFYWMKQVKNEVVIVIADCTGHGVPGAFMSMLGISLLNEMISSVEKYEAAMILNRLREKVKSTLKQTGDLHEGKEGMDMALCIINLETLQCNFSGANNPLLLLRNGEIIEYEADNQPVSIHILETEFTNKKVQLQKNDQLFMFSDGYVDQFGGQYYKKYRIRTFKEFLIKIEKDPFEMKKMQLEKEFEDWKGNTLQIDDVLVFGMKI